MGLPSAASRNRRGLKTTLTSVLLDGIVHTEAGTARYRESLGGYNHTVKLCLDDHDGAAGSIG